MNHKGKGVSKLKNARTKVTHCHTFSDISVTADPKLRFAFGHQDKVRQQAEGECAWSCFTDLTQVVASRCQMDAKSHQQFEYLCVPQLRGDSLKQDPVATLDAVPHQ